jgi:hypothetical protein
MQNTGENNVQSKLLTLAMGDYKLENRLASLYYKSFQDLKDLYAVGLIKRDPKLLGFIRHKYQAAFQRLHLPGLSEAIEQGDKNLGEADSNIAVNASVENVRQLCEQFLNQLEFYYPWLKENTH